MDAEEKRRSVRIETRLEVIFRSDGVESTGFIEDYSETGMWIDTPQPLPLRSDLLVEFRLGTRETDRPVTARATVVRVEPTIGMVLAFRGLVPSVGEQIRLYVADRFFSS